MPETGNRRIAWFEPLQSVQSNGAMRSLEKSMGAEIVPFLESSDLEQVASQNPFSIIIFNLNALMLTPNDTAYAHFFVDSLANSPNTHSTPLLGYSNILETYTGLNQANEFKSKGVKIIDLKKFQPYDPNFVNLVRGYLDANPVPQQQG